MKKYNMLSCVNISPNKKKLFYNFSISLLPGAIYILQGSNGSGKTTLLKIIAGINSNYFGNILWNNTPLDLNVYHKYVVGYLGHENSLKNNLSVKENLLIWADIKNTHLLLAPAIAQFKLEEYLDLKCKYLSAGLKKRVALARVILSNSFLWLLDEPESNLDKEGLELLLKLLQAKVNSGGIVIIASHNIDFFKKVPTINIEDFKVYE